jgi:protein-tyrosine-phosphatase
MAEAMLRDIVTRDPILRSSRIEADSAGMNPVFSVPTEEAVDVMREYGIDLTGHRSKPVRASLVDWADLILVMEARHKHLVSLRFPEAKGKTLLLSEYAGNSGDVDDPYGMGMEEYRRCAVLLRSLVERVAQKIGGLHG